MYVLCIKWSTAILTICFDLRRYDSGGGGEEYETASDDCLPGRGGYDFEGGPNDDRKRY